MHCATSPTRLGLFGQILAALYQTDVVEEDDIRAWHKLKTSQGGDIEDAAVVENMNKCWMIGSKMIEQFDEQEDETESETESEQDGEEESEAESGTGTDTNPPSSAEASESESGTGTETASGSDEESESE